MVDSYSLYDINKLVDAHVGTACSPDYCPPNMRWVRQGVYVPAGRYFKAGIRIKGQYQDVENMSAYWDISSAKYAYLHNVVSGWDSSGIQGANYQGWQSVFLVGDTNPRVVMTPFAEVVAVSYDGPSDTTTVVLGCTGNTGTAKMQNWNCPYPFRAWADTEYNTSYAAWEAFDGISLHDSDCWYAGGGQPHWLKYDFNLPRKVVAYRMRSRNYAPDDPIPYSWTIQGSNNDSSYVTLDTRTNQAHPGDNVYSPWYTCATRGLYRYYMLRSTASTGGDANATSISNLHYKTGTDLRFDSARLIHIPLDPCGETAGYTLQVTNPSDPLVLSGDHVNSGAKLSVGSVLQVAPPTSTPSLYLGCCMIGEYGCIERYIKKKWNYTWTRSIYTDEAYKAISDIGTTYVADGVPPTATFARLYNFGGQDDSQSMSGMQQLYCHGTGTTDYTVLEHEFNPEGSNSWRSQEPFIQWPMSYTMRIRNRFRSHQYGTWYIPEYGFISFNGFIE
jgi:hypothetical protein